MAGPCSPGTSGYICRLRALMAPARAYLVRNHSVGDIRTRGRPRVSDVDVRICRPRQRIGWIGTGEGRVCIGLVTASGHAAQRTARLML
jgi:hypothetical protein